MRILAAALLAFGMLAGGQAAAEKARSADAGAQVRNYLRTEAAKHIAEGYRPDPANPDFVRALTTDDAVIWPITLRHGATYRVMAVCDNNCADVDMDLYDASGAFVGSDVTTTDKPYVEITPSADGVAFARIWLATCETEPCTIGARVYVKASR